MTLLTSGTDGLPSRAQGLHRVHVPLGEALVREAEILRKECGGDCRGPTGA